MYVLNLNRILNKKFNQNAQVDLFTFLYVANATYNTSEDNNNIFYTEISIRNGLKNPVKVNYFSSKVVKDYLNARNNAYGGDNYDTVTTEVTVYTKDEEGAFVPHTELQTFVVNANR